MAEMLSSSLFGWLEKFVNSGWSLVIVHQTIATEHLNSQADKRLCMDFWDVI